MDGYNGWTNRETWAVTLWFDLTTQGDVENAKAYLEEEFDKLPDVMREFCNIDLINWDELMDAVEVEEEEQGDTFSHS